MNNKPKTAEKPLTGVEFHILLTLFEGPRHGYGIMQDVEALTEGRIQLGPGTLYGSLKRLLEPALIEECEPDGERRRCYRLTRTGKRAVTEEARHLLTLARVVRKRGILAATS